MVTMELEKLPIEEDTDAVPPADDTTSRESSRMLEYFVRQTSLGAALVATSQDGLCAVLLGDDEDALRSDLAARFPARRLHAGEETGAWVREALAHVDGAKMGSARPPLDLKGTEFQKSVWMALLDIPAGKTVTYSQLAAMIGRPSSVRAVSRACGANPIAVIVPCHRVLRGDGGISGYRWGVERKRAILDREGVALVR